MNIKTLNSLALTALLGLAIAGCSKPAAEGGETASGGAHNHAEHSHAEMVKEASYEPGSIKAGDRGYCIVCVYKGGEGEEPIVDTLDYEGKTYAFCTESEKAQFISDPGKYLDEGHTPTGEGHDH